MSSAVAVKESAKGWDSLTEAFPDVDCGHTACGQYVIVQIRRARDRIGSIILTDQDKDTEHDNTQIARVVDVAPGAFRFRDSGALWPEGPWYGVGDFVRCPKYGGDRWRVPFEITIPEQRAGNVIVPARIERGKVEFAMFRENDIRCRPKDPLSVRAFF